MVGGSLQ
jgi:hypothetical protein